MKNVLLTILGTVVVPGSAVILVRYLILHGTGELTTPSLGVIEVVCIVLAFIRLSMVPWLSIAFVVYGNGTPVPIEPPKTLVAAGLCRFVRNPMYFGALLTLLAETAFFRSA